MVLVLPLFHKWKYWHHCFFMKYGILCISHTYIKTTIFHHEIWNSLYSLYQNLGTNAPSWTLDFGIVHIWRSEWRFSYKKYGNLYILIEPLVLWVLKHVLCYVSVPVPCTCACTGVCLYHLCLWMGHGSGPLQTQRWGSKNMRHGTRRREAQGIHSLGETGSRICVVSMPRTAMKEGWPGTAPDSGSTNLQLHK